MVSHNILIMLVKEFRQIRRDRRTLGLIIGMPAMMLIMFGFAVAREIRHLPLGLYDADRSRISREYIRAFTAPGSYDLVLEATSTRKLIENLDGGVINAALIIGPHFSKHIMMGKAGEAQIFIDGSDPQVAITGFGNAKQITFARSLEIVRERMRRVPGRAGPSPFPIPGNGPSALARYWYNPDLKKVNFYVPSLLGLIITQVTLILTSLAIVREKEFGSMELLLSSPLSPAELLLGKILPYLILAFVDVTIVLILSLTVFRVPVNGSLFTFYVLSMLYVFTSLSIGLTFSSLANTQQQALYLIMFYMILGFLLSGFVFPIITMPKFMQYITYIVPLRYYLNILRGVITKGVGFKVLAPEIAGLATIGLFALVLSIKTFKRTLD